MSILCQSKNFTCSSKIPIPLAVPLNDNSSSGLIRCWCQIYQGSLQQSCAPDDLCQRIRSLLIPITGPWKGPIFFIRMTHHHHQMASYCQGYLESPKQAGAPTPYKGDSPTMVLGLINARIPRPAPRVGPCLHVVALELPHFSNNRVLKIMLHRSAVCRLTVPPMHTWTCIGNV